MTDLDFERRLQFRREATCDTTGKSRIIHSPVIVVADTYVGFGPAGLEDLFVQDELGVLCYDCLSNAYKAIYEPYANI